LKIHNTKKDWWSGSSTVPTCLAGKRPWVETLVLPEKQIFKKVRKVMFLSKFQIIKGYPKTYWRKH
jgi:hypothetical protein